MIDRRKLKTYKFGSARIEIYVDESVQQVEFARIGKFRVTEEKVAPVEYFMRITYGNKYVVNSQDPIAGLSFLKGYALQYAKRELRK